MHKQVIKADVPETAGPFNLCVRYGNMIYISGLPPFDAEYAAKLRAARAAGEPIPPFPDLPFERLVDDLVPARDLSRNPLYQVSFVLQNATGEPLALPGMAVEPVPAMFTWMAFTPRPLLAMTPKFQASPYR